MSKRNIVLAAIAAAFLVALGSAVPARAAQPFGSFGGIVGGGNAGDGSISLFGWALADSGVAAVDVLVDGQIDGRATYGRSRPGVALAHPGFPDSAAAGWVYNLDSTRYLNGLHTVSARVRGNLGETADLNSKVFEFSNVPADLVPFGKIEFPNANAELFGDCGQVCEVGFHPGDFFGDLFAPTPFISRRYNAVSGWALDPGTNANDQGVGYVELLIDRALYLNSNVNCFYDPRTGGLTDCYGLRRLDISNAYPSIRDSLHSGFRWVLDVSQLINCGLYAPGHHTLTVRTGDQFGTVREVAEIPVTFSCADFGVNDPAVGQIDLPPAGLLYSGNVLVTGWALDFNRIARVTVLIDGVVASVGSVTSQRPGVTALYPGYPDSPNPGFRIPLDSRRFSNGKHSLQVVVADTLGSDTLLGEVTVTIDNTNQ